MKRNTLSRVVVAAVAVVLCTNVSADEAASDVRVRVDSEHREVVVTVGPIEIPAATLYSHHPSEERMRFRWPVGGFIRGYRMDLFDSDGRLLPREMLHHAGVANLERRQLPYPLVERLVAVGRQTRPVMLPDSMGIPMAPGQELLMYYALVNPADEPLKGATLKLTVAWTPERKKPPRAVFPLYLDANPRATGGTRAFEIPPGVSATSAEFTLPAAGRLRALGAHLHDYAVEIRLEDVVTGKVLARLKTRRHVDGRLISVNSTRFFFKRRGLHLDADHQYRVVGIYDNPTSATIPAGAMAFLAGPFIPDDADSWPAIEPTNEEYQRDLADILGESSHAAQGHGTGGHH